ncbi:TlpA family protein disulfide reductase [Robiginitalea sp. IMCC44478]|uniref:TlpA family protein disulfide reductase n=1 Tax=Robiginitalea sp. IMCC44478 TaxID=3459122 RepID=UPI004042F4F3
MKKFWKPIASGIVVALLLVLVMWQLTMNFQLLLFIGAALFFAAGYFNTSGTLYNGLKVLIITVFYGLFFVLLVLEQLPQLWYFIPIYMAATWIGLLFAPYKRKALAGLAALLIMMLVLALELIPRNLEDMLVKERYEALPEFTIRHMDGAQTAISSLEGKVVILDFFGTWCKPCILELRELDKIQKEFGEEVEFFVINADQGGDTPEKFQAFIDKNEYTFNFAYDHDSEIFKTLEMAHLGLPTLLVIDKEQRIRLQHVGYNPAETRFVESLTRTINELK